MSEKMSAMPPLSPEPSVSLSASSPLRPLLSTVALASLPVSSPLTPLRAVVLGRARVPSLTPVARRELRVAGGIGSSDEPLSSSDASTGTAGAGAGGAGM